MLLKLQISLKVGLSDVTFCSNVWSTPAGEPSLAFVEDAEMTV